MRKKTKHFLLRNVFQRNYSRRIKIELNLGDLPLMRSRSIHNKETEPAVGFKMSMPFGSVVSVHQNKHKTCFSNPNYSNDQKQN